METTCQHLRAATKAVLRGKLIAINAQVKKKNLKFTPQGTTKGGRN